MSQLPVVELLAVATEKKRKLSTSERRKVISYLEEMGDKRTNYALADLFLVSETTIRADKKRLVVKFVQELTPARASFFVADYLRDINQLIATCQNALRNTDDGFSGSLGERVYIETLMKLLKEKFSALQEIGVVQKTLGNLNVREEVWVATVDTVTGEQGIHRADPQG